MAEMVRSGRMLNTGRNRQRKRRQVTRALGLDSWSSALLSSRGKVTDRAGFGESSAGLEVAMLSETSPLDTRAHRSWAHPTVSFHADV